jgi:hypothetical protein
MWGVARFLQIFFLMTGRTEDGGNNHHSIGEKCPWGLSRGFGGRVQNNYWLCTRQSEPWILPVSLLGWVCSGSTCRFRPANTSAGGVISTVSAAILAPLQHVAAELNEGTDYLLLPDGPPETAGAAALATLRQLLSHSPAPLTLQEILARWRSLTRGCELGLLVRTGAGTKAEAFRYRLAEGGPPQVVGR